MTEYWDKYWEGVKSLRLDVKNDQLLNKIDFLLKKFLPFDTSKKFIEIGCAPARWGIYFKENFGYKIYGIDKSKYGYRLTLENLKKSKIKANIICEDFMKAELKQKFDVVLSAGFIEHFEDLNLVVRKHDEILKSNGYLVLEIPNMTGDFNFFIENFLDKEDLLSCNTDAMDIGNVVNLINKDLNYKILFAGYVGGVGGMIRSYLPKVLLKIFKPPKEIKNSGVTDRFEIFLKHLPIISESRLFSPSILIIAKKR